MPWATVFLSPLNQNIFKALIFLVHCSCISIFHHSKPNLGTSSLILVLLLFKLHKKGHQHFSIIRSSSAQIAFWATLLFNPLNTPNKEESISTGFSLISSPFLHQSTISIFLHKKFHPQISNSIYIIPHTPLFRSVLALLCACDSIFHPNISNFIYIIPILLCFALFSNVLFRSVFERRVNASLYRREMLSLNDQQCATGNPIDDCWRCSSTNWADNRQQLADCGIGFGADAMGGKGGQIYIVTDSSDRNPANPTPGTLRHAVIQTEPLWITFSSDMTVKLKAELIVNSFKTIDGRGHSVHVTGGGCITLQYVSNVIIHNIHVHHCKPAGNTNVASSPTHVGWRGKSDGDGISLFGARKVWIDHCSLSYCADGLIDAIMGSTGITISSNYFAHHDEVMLLGHDDKYLPDSGMQVTIAFNHFGEALVQRMPRCRRGYIHVVNNDFTQWEMYAIGGSANPTINSQGNRYTAPTNQNAKEVTKRVDTNEGDWDNWNWRTEGDIMVNGAFFVPSGAGMSTQYAKASSIEPKSVGLIDRLTVTAGVFGDPRDSSRSESYNSGSGTITDGTTNTGSGGYSGGDGDYFGMIFGSSAQPSSSSHPILLSLLIILILYVTTNHGGLLSLPSFLTLLL